MGASQAAPKLAVSDETHGGQPRGIWLARRATIGSTTGIAKRPFH
jgi:hypothetical protein